MIEGAIGHTIVLGYLRAMREKLTPEGAWTQEVFARDARGRPTYEDNPLAVSWCINGALLAVAPGGQRDAPHRFLRRAAGLGAGQGLSVWNDTLARTQTEVLAIVDRAIELCKKEGEDVAE